MTWVDSHCHVHDERIPDGTAAAVAAARESGVATMITVGCDRATSDWRRSPPPPRHPGVCATVGLHPHDAATGVESITDLLDTPGIVAVGEAGLDYYYDHSPRDAQREAFAAQIQLAHDHGLPLVIHSRDAWDDTFDILAAEGVPDPHDLPLLHRRPRRGPALPRSRGVRQLLGHRHVQERHRRPGRGRAVPARPAARRDRQPVPGAGPPPRRDEPPGLGAARRAVHRRTARADHGACRGVQLGRRRPCVPVDRFLAWIAHRASASSGFGRVRAEPCSNST